MLRVGNSNYGFSSNIYEIVSGILPHSAPFFLSLFKPHAWSTASSGWAAVAPGLLHFTWGNSSSMAAQQAKTRLGNIGYTMFLVNNGIDQLIFL